MRLLFRGSTADTMRIFDLWLLLFCEVRWDCEEEDKDLCDCEEDLGEDKDLCDSELQELPPEDPLPSLIWFLPLLTWSQVWEA